MKKTFQLTHPKIKPARLIEAVRRDVKKYLKREKRKSFILRINWFSYSDYWYNRVSLIKYDSIQYSC